VIVGALRRLEDEAAALVQIDEAGVIPTRMGEPDGRSKM
jgi:hypothetical protein